MHVNFNTLSKESNELRCIYFIICCTFLHCTYKMLHEKCKSVTDSHGGKCSILRLLVFLDFVDVGEYSAIVLYLLKPFQLKIYCILQYTLFFSFSELKTNWIFQLNQYLYESDTISCKKRQ